MKSFEIKVEGAMYGVAIGDGMGAPVEGWLSEAIFARFTGVETFLPPTHGGDPQIGKGAGRMTDDTLMTEALINAYSRWCDHIDAYVYRDFMLPEISKSVVWVPERQKSEPILDRLFWPEKYPWIRMVVNNVDPRQAGTGNRVNCGIAMYMLPVGAVNFGDPTQAYQEAVALGIAHNESFAVEAGAVTASAYAEAFAADSSIESVYETAVKIARDGTRRALEQAYQAADPALSLKDFCQVVGRAVAPFLQTHTHLSDSGFEAYTGLGKVGQPSSSASIEELPAALAALRYGAGDFNRTLAAGVFYGNDCDSIAGIACGLYGALFGADSIPSGLKNESDRVNRRSFSNLAGQLVETAQLIFAKDRARFERRQLVISST
jgi:ADP-ribosylglycohydrolase